MISTSTETAERFELIIPQVVKCLKNPNNRTVSQSLSIVQLILDWPSTSLKRLFNKMVISTISILKGLTSLDHDLIRSSFKVVNGLLLHGRYPLAKS